jgi:hypothetical protein
MPTESETPTRRFDALALLAGNLLALIPLVAWAALTPSRSQPVLDLVAMYLALATVFVVPLTLLVERPLVRRMSSRVRPFSLLEELAILGGVGAALAIPGGIIFGFIGVFQNFDGYNATFASSFGIGAIACGLIGSWVALMGRWACQATKHSRVVSIVILVVIAAAVVGTLVLFVVRSL